MIATKRHKREDGNPIVNCTIILLCVSAFILLQSLANGETLKYAYSLVPYEITTGTDLTETFYFNDAVTGSLLAVPHQRAPLSVYFNFLSSTFIHANFFHLFGNLLFLSVFGNSVEKRLGHSRYLLLFLLSGFVAAAFQIIATPLLQVFMMGASGAASGVTGSYLVLYPREKLEIEVFSLPLQIPVVFAIIAWMLSQMASTFVIQSDLNSIAHIAHIGGFAAGVVMAAIISQMARERHRVLAELRLRVKPH